MEETQCSSSPQLMVSCKEFITHHENNCVINFASRNGERVRLQTCENEHEHM